MAIVVAGIAILITLAVVGSMGGQLNAQRFTAMGQDNVRVAVEELTRDLRSAGSGTDYAAGQNRFVYASAYTVAFNANLAPDDDNPTAAPTAVDPGLANAAVPLDDGASFTPPSAYSTGAETVVLTLDSNRDGELTAADAADQEDETDTPDPSDYVVSAYSYGVANAANEVTTRGLALVRGPAAGDGAGAPEPLFKYWIDADNNTNTPAVLHGDTDGDGHLSASEIAALTPVASTQLALIERIDVAAQPTMKSTSGAGVNGGFSNIQAPVMRSTVSFRNRNSTTAHIVGTVYNDVDRDGRMETGELPIRDVSVRCSNGMKTRTDTNGHYQLILTPATYTISEVDPAGYISTTPNAVSISPSPGEYKTVDFGDHANTGTVHGTVYSDNNQNQTRDGGERGLAGRNIALDTGVSVLTSSSGNYQFALPVGTYVVTETDSVSWISSTPNAVSVTIHSVGDSVRADFGDYKLANTGTIHGVIYADANNNRVRDTGEAGIPSVTVDLDDGQMTNSSQSGEFRFTATPGHHRVTETDPPGYTSSTVNAVDLNVVLRQTVEVAFGDIAPQNVQFQEISLGNTQNALSLTTIDTGEDSKNDLDLVLGTHYVGGSNDVLVWWNARTNSNTPNSGIFPQAPSYSRVVAYDVNSIAAADLNGDGNGDIVTVLGAPTNDLNVWQMQTGGNKGRLPNAPNANYTASGATGVFDVALGKCDNDSYKDMVVGTYSSATTGKLEVWHGASNGTSFTRATKDLMALLPGTTLAIGAVRAVALADFDGDGHSDIVVAAQTATNLAQICLLMYAPNVLSDYQLRNTIPITGVVQDVMALDMREDNDNDVDIIVAVATSTNAGEIQVWHNRGDNTFGAGVAPNVTPSDTANPGGVPLCLAQSFVDNDVFPDLIVGTRSGTYAGQVLLYRAFGFIPTNGIVISTTSIGEVITSTIGDFNLDGAPDLAVGTRTAATSGKVVVYFNVRTSV